MPTDLTEDDWNSHKATIRSLYLTENLKLQGPGGVMQEMLTKYGFNATKAQYERRFKKWKFQKNKTKDVWEAVAREVTKRKRDSKDSEVRIGGEVVPVKKLKKELSRYGYEAAFPHGFQAPTPKTPEDLSLVVYTPPSHNLEYKWPSNLPWLRFEQKYSQSIYVSNFNLSSALEKRPSLLCDALCLVSEGRSLVALSDISIDKGAMALSCIMPEVYEGQNLARAHSIFSPSPPGVSLETVKILLYALSNSLINDLGNMETTTAFAQTFLNAWADRPREPFDDLSTEPTLVALLGKCFQAACNSLDPDVMELCMKMGASPNLTVWDSERKAFMKPIQIAAFTEHIEVAELLVRHGADVNETGSRKQPTALSIAFLLQNTPISRLLLDSGANPNLQFDPAIINEYYEIMINKNIYDEWWLGDFSPLSILVANIWVPSAGSGNSHVELLQDVLDKAARDSRSESLHEEHLAHLILVAVSQCNPKYFQDVIRTLIRCGGNINTESISGILPISLASHAWRGRCSSLLSLNAEPSPPRTSRHFHVRPAALHIAALNGDIATIQALLEAGADVNHYVTLKDEDLKINSAVLAGLDAWDFQDTPSANGLLQRYHTPLQFALAISGLGLDMLLLHGSESKPQIARLLLHHGAKLFGGEMVNAVELGDLALVRLLHSEHGASLDDKSVYGLTPVQTGIRHNFDDIAKFLIDSGAKLEGREISDAIIAKRPDEFLEYLESHQATSGQEGIGVHDWDGLAEAFATGEEHTISQILLLWPLHYESIALCAAVLGIRKSTNKRRLTELVEEFLQRNPSEMSFEAENTAIAMAARYGNTDVLEIFLRKFSSIGSQVCFLPFKSMGDLLCSFAYNWGMDWVYHIQTSTALDCSPLASAVVEGSEEVVGRLLDHGFCPDVASVLLAILSDRRELLIRLLDKGANPNRRYAKFDTPLQMAVRLNRTEIIRDFLELEVNINSDPPPAPWGHSFEPRTALQLAIESGNVDLVHRLIDAGADVNGPAARHSGATALQLAAAKGYFGLAKLLIEHGADINADGARKSGRTALEIAAEHGRIDIVQFFLNHVPGALTNGDHTHKYIRAVRFAERNGHMAAAMVLRNCRDWSPQDFELYEEYEELSDQEDEPGEGLDEIDEWEALLSDSEDG
ncbi:ankyrin repeat-containing domain protein [Leptodontidium sp. MPI-SDFR-AT-0119]|nr:ankyrin repeat-containing domain protein [Leptodontidium sp. MPI-SDFR-AT-0119]